MEGSAVEVDEVYMVKAQIGSEVVMLVDILEEVPYRMVGETENARGGGLFSGFFIPLAVTFTTAGSSALTRNRRRNHKRRRMEM